MKQMEVWKWCFQSASCSPVCASGPSRQEAGSVARIDAGASRVLSIFFKFLLFDSFFFRIFLIFSRRPTMEHVSQVVVFVGFFLLFSRRPTKGWTGRLCLPFA